MENAIDNGVRLPANEALALLCGRPLHRGPHPRYNREVIEWVRSIAHPITGALRHAEDAMVAAGFCRIMVRELRALLATVDGAGELITVNEITIPLPMGREPIAAQIDRLRAKGRLTIV